ncbi:GtrA family protein [bacterium]|nr:GtrA family protein [bacterium]
MFGSPHWIHNPMRFSQRMVKKPPPRLIRFVITGGLSTVVHQSTALASITMTSIGYGGGNALGFVAGTSVAYILNTRWSFKQGFRLKNMITYWLVSMIGLALSYGIGGLCDALAWPYWVVMMLTVGMVPFMSYTCHSRWTYR